MTQPAKLPTTEALTQAYKAIDDRWAEIEKANRSPVAADVLDAIAHLAVAIGHNYETDAQERENEYSTLQHLALTLRNALEQAAEPGDPATEYQRLLRLAEEQATRNPAASEALAKIADRWLVDALIPARRHSPHFGSDQA